MLEDEFARIDALQHNAIIVFDSLEVVGAYIRYIAERRMRSGLLVRAVDVSTGLVVQWRDPCLDGLRWDSSKTTRVGCSRKCSPVACRGRRTVASSSLTSMRRRHVAVSPSRKSAGGEAL